ncbi:hypothetical protein GCM10020219_100090 [Nonomuraea dietziae]
MPALASQLSTQPRSNTVIGRPTGTGPPCLLATASRWSLAAAAPSVVSPAPLASAVRSACTGPSWIAASQAAVAAGEAPTVPIGVGRTACAPLAAGPAISRA